jgi:KUP system potassium uptake protein
VPGTGIFLTRTTEGTPPLMIAHVGQMGALHQNLIALTVRFEDVPRVPAPDRFRMVQVLDSFWHVTIRYGFIEVPDLPAALRAAKDVASHVDLDQAMYFAARDEVVHSKTAGILSRWRLPLFAFLFRNSVRASDLFALPAANFVELGRQIEI